MNKRNLIIPLLGVLIMVATAFHILQRSALAACGGNHLSHSCSTNYGLIGSLSAVESSSANIPRADQAFLVVPGGLAYADYKQLEAQARMLLSRNMGFRQDISPYRGTNNFNDLVRQFDANSGFEAPYEDPDPAITQMTLEERIDLADKELRQARDLYAYLAIYAPVQQLRKDDGKNPISPGDDYKGVLCKYAENPNPPDTAHSGHVLEPVIDWCNFPARMRQAVREAAYLRMIFAQQFMVDALGLHFSAGALIGGDNFVRKEVVKLQAAKSQFELAEKGLNEAMDRPLGNGCNVSDFYTQSEWALFSQAIQGQEVAQHHIATRLSYLDITSVNDETLAEKRSLDAFRTATTNGYIKLIGMSRLGVQPSSSRCQWGESLDSRLVSEMATNMADTRTKVRELNSNRNPFGFDLRFTPARPYRTAFGSSDEGLWEQAYNVANLALLLQQQTENAERVFDLNQQELVKSIVAINEKVDYDIQAAAGCDLQGFATDTAYYACVDTMINETASCDPTSDSFDSCMARTTDGKPPAENCSNCVVLVSTLRQTRQDLRAAWIGVKNAQQRSKSLLDRIKLEQWRNARVKSAMFAGVQDVAGYEAAIVFANCCSIQTGTDGLSYGVNPGAFVETILRPLQMMRQAATDMEIEDKNSEAAIRSFFIDMAEAQGEIELAVEQYNSMLTNYNGVVGQLLHDVFESKRQHAYTAANPANDPSYRIVRDSRRIELAQRLMTAARLAYLAARRAEYEYNTRLSSSNFRISDIHKPRTANDILIFLQNLDTAVSNLPGSVKDADINQSDLTISVAHHVLGLTDSYLRGLGIADANLQSERERIFQQWLTQHTSIDKDGKAIITFNLTIPAGSKGLISQVVQQDYDYFWMHKVAGIGQPKAANNGFGLNLVTAQSGNLGFRTVRVSQEGQVSLRNFAGCIFDYRLMPPALMLGLEYASNQPTDVVTGLFQGDINGVKGNTAPGFSTPAFLGRPLAATSWQVVINAGSPDGVLPDLNLQQLKNIELKISTTYATRLSTTPPTASQCVRADF